VAEVKTETIKHTNQHHPHKNLAFKQHKSRQLTYEFITLTGDKMRK